MRLDHMIKIGHSHCFGLPAAALRSGPCHWHMIAALHVVLPMLPSSMPLVAPVSSALLDKPGCS